MPNTATRTILDCRKDAAPQGTVQFEIFDIGASFVVAGRELEPATFSPDRSRCATAGPPR